MLTNTSSRVLAEIRQWEEEMAEKLCSRCKKNPLPEGKEYCLDCQSIVDMESEGGEPV